MVDAPQNLQELALIQTGPLAVECPSCGKHCIVETAPNTYQCLSCNFSRDLTQTDASEDNITPNGTGLFFTVLIAILATIALL